jgi:ferric-dicitrate binding protein FerR (iron transport regulator)
MTIPVPPDVPLRDEEALKRLFFSQQAVLGEKARAKLGADAVALAPKVVEGVFVRAWDARANFKSTSELEHFLADDVQHAAARALSRRAAAHRFAGAKETHHDNAGTINPDESWGHIMHALHGEEHKPGTLTAVAHASRHEAATHIAGMGKSRGLAIGIGLAVVAVGLVIAGMKWLDVAAAKGKVAQALNASDVRVVATPPGRAGEVSLSDGSTAHVAPDSKLTIPKDMGPELRGVKIEGAAQFEVAPGLKEPFQVHVRDAVAVATGTTFTVAAYPEDSAAVVVVKEGTVEVRRGDAPPTPVAVGAGLVITKTGMRPATPDEVGIATGWRTGTFALTNATLKDGVTGLKRWYGYEVHVADLSLLKRTVSVKASLDSAMQAVQQIAKSGGLRFGYAGDNMAYIDTSDKKTKLRL